jgi:hypothetical protein
VKMNPIGGWGVALAAVVVVGGAILLTRKAKAKAKACELNQERLDRWKSERGFEIVVLAEPYDDVMHAAPNIRAFLQLDPSKPVVLIEQDGRKFRIAEGEAFVDAPEWREDYCEFAA